MGDTKAGKPGVFRWGGILASRGHVMQAMVFVAVSVATIAFAFAQLGLVGLGEPNEGMTYAVVQLVPVAIAALLFGPLGGALLGLIAGAALLVHSHVQPLDFFEVYFITPVSSCVLLLAAGFVLGLMFAAALRRDPSAGRRAAGIVADPIDRVNRALERIAEGDLATRTDEGSSRELASLSEGVNTMTVALEKQFAQIKEGIKRELDAAAVIQESALPRAFPPFPDIPRFDIYAGMQPAREVGGDFYDFFLIGDACDAESGKLGFVVADVSGKGVPAALFMMAAKTAIRGYMESGMELGEAFENANRKLCAGNDSAMFVTAFAGVLDYATGSIAYVNAGHNAPFLRQHGEWRQLTDKSGLPLGLFDGIPYKAFECTCAIGDELLLYTDGVIEAMDVDDALYGLDRLKALLDDNLDLHPRELIELVRRDVTRFSEGAEQADDITMLALEFGVPPEVTATITVPANDRELPHVTEFVHTELDRRLCPVRAQRQLDIALEELFVNVAHYAYPDATPDRPGEVRVSYTYSAEPPSITVEIEDEGIPFDPLSRPDAVTPTSIEDVPIGGLGILMAKRSVDEMRYERTDGTNVVTITKRWSRRRAFAAMSRRPVRARMRGGVPSLHPPAAAPADLLAIRAVVSVHAVVLVLRLVHVLVRLVELLLDIAVLAAERQADRDADVVRLHAAANARDAVLEQRAIRLGVDDDEFVPADAVRLAFEA